MDIKFDHKPEGLDIKGRITIPGFTIPTESQRTEDAIIDDQGDLSFADAASENLSVLDTILDPPETREPEQAPLDLLKSALTLIIPKAEALDIHVDKAKLVGKLKGALEILNKN